MNTIYESTNGELTNTGKPITTNSSTCIGPGSTSSNTTATSQSVLLTDASSSSQTSATDFFATNNSNTSSGDKFVSDLKIISHLKNIERLSDKRRLFLNTESSSVTGVRDQASVTKNRLSSESAKINGSECGNFNGTSLDETAAVAAAVAIATDDDIAISNNIRDKYLQNLRFAEKISVQFDSSTTTEPGQDLISLPSNHASPSKTPPPKPPMLSRNRSLGSNSDRTASPRSPTKSAYTPTNSPIRMQSSSPPDSTPSTTTVVTTTTVATPAQATTVELGETPVMRRSERPKSLSPDVAAPKQITANHYERLIEELKCPGCAFPMKGQVLLCKTGHSICAQCTRVLMLCPLCKEPFTNIRSLTVEALCSKAHFRCSNASGGCTVRLQIDLLGWHEKQCIYKPMKCFMGRVYGDCSWTGREANWKEHLESEHANKVFTEPSVDLVWDMSVKQKPLTGYYVFEVYGEMFNFYEVYDKERVLFTMSCTSALRERKLNFAFEVTALHKDNEALAITQKFPVHSEYDKDILLEGTCVSMSLAELAKFIDCDKLLHYRVRVLEVRSPRRSRISQISTPIADAHPLDFQKTQIEGVNLKLVPADVIVTRKLTNPLDTSKASPENGVEASAATSSDEDFDIRREYQKTKAQNSKDGACNSDSDPEFEAFIAKKWGTPQLHFNRKYLKNQSSDSSSAEESSSQSKNRDVATRLEKKFSHDVDKMSLCSTNTSYKKKVTNTLRKSFRSLKTDIIDLKPFGKKSSPEKKLNS